MQTFDQSIFGLYQQGFVTLEEALRWASNVDEFKLKVQGISHDRRHGARRDGRAGRRRTIGAAGAGNALAWQAGNRLVGRHGTRSACGRRRPRRPDSDGLPIATGAAPARRRELSTASAARACSIASTLRDDVDAAIARLIETRALDDEPRGHARTRGRLLNVGPRAPARRSASFTPRASPATSPPPRSPTSSASSTSGRWSTAPCRRSSRHRRSAGHPAEHARLYQHLMRQGFTPAVVAPTRCASLREGSTVQLSRHASRRDPQQLPRVLRAARPHASCPARRSCRTTTRRCCSPTPG